MITVFASNAIKYLTSGAVHFNGIIPPLDL